MYPINLLQGLALVQCAFAATGSPKASPATLAGRSLWRNIESDGETLHTSTSLYESIVPSEKLEWVPCHSPTGNYSVSSADEIHKYDCARLLVSHSPGMVDVAARQESDWDAKVPYDYSDPNTSQGQFSIALIRYRAKNKANYKGPIFLNFGGPGVSGTERLIGAIPNGPDVVFDTLLGDYDIVSWDPRGCGSTLPALTCYGDIAARDEATLRSSDVSIYASNDSLIQLDALYQVRAAGCTKYSGDTLPYFGTYFVIQDLRRMVEAYGYSDKISFYGTSYGTQIGAMYAAMYPDKIERMILDAVMDPTEAFKEFVHPTQGADIAGILEDFAHWCFLAGELHCPFWFDGEGNILRMLYETWDRLRTHPVAAEGWVLNWSKFMDKFHQGLYSPIEGFPAIAQLLGAVHRGQYNKTYAEFKGQDATAKPAMLMDPIKNMTNSEGENQAVIDCVDRPSFQVTEIEEFDRILKSDLVTKVGPFSQYLVGGDIVPCGRITTDQAKRFNGSYQDVETKNPILWVTTIRDPITPYHMAFTASSGYPGSSVLVNNITGHGGMQQMSKCMVNHIKTYLDDAVVPPLGTMCQPLLLPFGLFANGTSAPENVTTYGILNGQQSSPESIYLYE